MPRSIYLSCALMTLGVLTPLPANAIGATVIQLSPAADTYVSSEYPNANYGDEGNLYVHAGSNTKRTYLRFELGGMDLGGIQAATLHMFFGQGGAQNPTVIDLHHVADDTWGEDTITWSNKKPYTATALATASTQFGNSEVIWTLPLDLFSTDTNGQLSLLLKLQDEGISDTATFFSKEATVHPAVPAYLALAVPEPDNWIMVLAGLGLVGWVARRHDRAGKN